MSQPPKYKTEKYHKCTQNYFGQNSHSICPDRFVSYRVLRKTVLVWSGGQISINENIVLMYWPLQRHFPFSWTR